MSFLTQGLINTNYNIHAWKPVLFSYFLHQSCPPGILLNDDLICEVSPTKTLPCKSMLDLKEQAVGELNISLAPGMRSTLHSMSTRLAICAAMHVPNAGTAPCIIFAPSNF